MSTRHLATESSLGGIAQEMTSTADHFLQPPAADAIPAVSSLASLFALPGRVVATTARMTRFLVEDPPTHVLLDRHESGAVAASLDCACQAGEALRLHVDGRYRLTTSPCGGWLLQPGDEHGPLYWLPRLPVVRVFGTHGHILRESTVGVGARARAPDGLDVEFLLPESGRFQAVVWSIPQACKALTDSLVAGRPDPCYLWGSHSRIDTPADCYVHIVHGQVHESRFAWPHHRKICSENDAHAIFVALTGWLRGMGLSIAEPVRQQVLLSVLARQGEDGGWRHGEWTEHNESHYRLHCSAMHLLMDALDESDDPVLRQALTRAAAFVAQGTDTLACGTWLLHDELERSEAALRSGPGRWLRSTALGKSPSNLLVLNSHLDTTIALDRYADTTGDPQYAALVASANRATEAVLALRPAQALYGLLFRVIGLSFLPTDRARALPVWKRALKRLGWKYLIPLLPRIKRVFPRLVMPGGYIDRELSAIGFAHDYHAVNLMDLARHQRRHRSAMRDQVLADGLRFVHDSGLDKRWKDMGYHRYALGFWAEALYQAYLFDARDEWLRWLADAALDLDDLDMGLPPSLLGSNAECTPVAQQHFFRLPEQTGLLQINLGRADAPQLLLVNTRKQALACQLPPDWVWRDDAGRSVPPGPVQLPSRGWMAGRGKT